MKNILKSLLKSRGYALNKINVAHTLVGFLRSRQVDLVLDVGANRGQFGQYLREHGYTGRIVSFEPIKSVFEQLSAVAAGDSQWEPRHYALGASEGQAEINVSDASDMSSLKATTDAIAMFNRSQTVRRETITIKRLDDIFAAFAGKKVFLKIDTQGYEREVLEGAAAALKSVAGVQLEVPILHLYQDSWTAAEVLNYMNEKGFVPAQMTPTTWIPNDSSSVTEFDCVFRRIS
jgi:FkbM family methyltransferase